MNRPDRRDILSRCRYTFLLKKGRALFFLTVLVIGLGICVSTVPSAAAATFTVDRTEDDVALLACLDETTSNTGENCTNGVDDDGDGFVDGNDPECDCSLRGAIIKANTTAGADTINLPAETYTLTNPGVGENAAATGDLDITDDLTIIGEGPAITIIQACTVDQKTADCPAGEGIADDRVFHVDPASAGIIVNINDVTVQNGGPDQNFAHLGNGGGILLGGHVFFSPGTGTLTLTNSVVRNNFSFNPANFAVGGGIHNNGGTLHVIDSTVSGNLSNNDGGGIGNNGSLTVSNSTISNNTNVHGQGGGIQSYGGVVSIDRSTIDGNGKPPNPTLVGCGGGMRVDHGELTVTNSTISGNRGGGDGGGLCISLSNANIPRAKVTLGNTTITGNTTLLPFAGQGGGGIISDGDPTLMSNTIVAGNTAANSIGHDCRGAFTSAGYNLIGDAIPAPNSPPWCTLTAATGDQVGTSSSINPQLAPLADNGGLTQTHALCTGLAEPHASCTGASPALDAGNPDEPGSTADACPATDQRGVNRFQDRCDIGAYEDQAAGGFTTDGVGPDHAGNVGPVCALIYGSGFANGATVKLTRAGEPDIVGNPVAGL